VAASDQPILASIERLREPFIAAGVRYACEDDGLKNRRLSLLFLANSGRAVEIDRNVPGSVPAAVRHTHDCAQHAKDSRPVTYAPKGGFQKPLLPIVCASCKCLYLVYLNTYGEVAERLKAAVC
jgi:hypothetical protein